MPYPAPYNDALDMSIPELIGKKKKKKKKCLDSAVSTSSLVDTFEYPANSTL